MAIVKMKKLCVIGLIEDCTKILDAASKLRVVEVSHSEIQNTEKREANPSAKEELLAKITRLDAAVVFVEDQLKERKPLGKVTKDKEFVKSFKKEFRPFLGGKNEITEQKFYSVSSKMDELNILIEEIEQLLKQNEAYLAEFDKFEEEKTRVYEKLKEVIAKLEACNSSLLEIKSLHEFHMWDLQKIESEQKLAFTQSVLDEVNKLTSESEILSAEKEVLLAELKKYEDPKSKIPLYENLKNINSKIVSYDKHLLEIKILHDYYMWELQKIECEEKLAFTESVFILEGFVPETEQSVVAQGLSKATEVLIIDFSDPAPDERIPTLNKNNKVFEPYEFVTNMYSVPDAREIDPNPFIMFFYAMFFGIMLADVFYGIIMLGLTILILKKGRPTGSSRNLIKVLFQASFSMILWGILFGAYFGFDNTSEGFGFLPPPLIGFTMMGNPLYALIMAAGFGVFHILFGMGIKAMQSIKDKKYDIAIFDVLPWYFIFGGLILMALGSFIDGLNLGLAPVIIILLGVAIIVIFGGRNKKGIVGKILGGLGGLYGAVGFLSDILSYARLFALGLAGGVIAMVFNILASLLVGNIIGWPFALAVFVFGHVFNIALNTLGTYVHDCRLQYVEFFKNFYKGEGYLFQPLGSDSKYTTLVAESVKTK